MRELINYILNKVVGPKIRFKKKMVYGLGTNFLPQFSLRIKRNNKVIIGEDCLLGVNIISEGDGDAVKFKFGDRVYIGKSQIICRTGIEFESNILVAWGVTFYDHDSHSLDFMLRREDITQQINDYKSKKGNYIHSKDWSSVKTKPIKVCKDSWIGMNALILKGVTIGEGAIVAASSVVTKDVPPFTVVAGNPAKEVKKLK